MPHRLGWIATTAVGVVALAAVIAYVTPSARTPRPTAGGPTHVTVRPAANVDRISSQPDGTQATSGLSVIESNAADGTAVNMRNRPFATSKNIDVLESGDHVTMTCWISSKAPGSGLSAKWFLVTESEPHNPVRGWISADLVWEQIQVPECDNADLNTDISNPDFLRNSDILLGRGNIAPSGGYYYAVRLTGFPAGWRMSVTCDGVMGAHYGPVGTITLIVDKSGNASNSDGCQESPDAAVADNGGGTTHEVIVNGPWLGDEQMVSADITWSAVANPPNAPTPNPPPTTAHTQPPPAKTSSPTSTLARGDGRIISAPCASEVAGPNTGAGSVACIPKDAVIHIDCTVHGSSVTGQYGATTLWDQTTYQGVSGYVSDAWVYTGTSGAVAGACTPPSRTGLVMISPCLNLRAGPNGGTALAGCVPINTRISINCTAAGDSVSGPFGATTLWDHTTYQGVSGYVSDAWVYTGKSGAVAGACAPPGGTGTIMISPCLNLRAGPNGSSTLVGCVPDKTTITIDCTAQGNSVTGPYGATTLWDHTTYQNVSGYVSDAYVYTGKSGPVAGPC